MQTLHVDSYMYNVYAYVYIYKYIEYGNSERKFPFLNSTLSFHINLFPLLSLAIQQTSRMPRLLTVLFSILKKKNQDTQSFFIQHQVSHLNCSTLINTLVLKCIQISISVMCNFFIGSQFLVEISLIIADQVNCPRYYYLCHLTNTLQSVPG